MHPPPYKFFALIQLRNNYSLPQVFKQTFKQYILFCQFLFVVYGLG